MHRLLLSATAHASIEDRLPTVAPDLELVVMGPDRTCTVDGEPIKAADAGPDLAWLTLDTLQDDLLGPMFGVILDPGSEVEWVQTFNAGLDDPVWRSVLDRGIRLCKSDAMAPPIAEYVMGHALSLILPIDEQRSLQERHRWERTPYKEVASTRWVLVGYGPIGKEITERLLPFGAHLTVVRRTQTAAGADAVTDLDHLRQVLPDADVVILACASNDETRGMADEAFFAVLKPGSILINIGRGDLVDEDALRAGLERSQPATAVLDVTSTEPLPPEHWLWDHPDVRLSGHTSSTGEGTVPRGADLFLENLGHYLADQPLRNEASPAEVGL